MPKPPTVKVVLSVPTVHAECVRRVAAEVGLTMSALYRVILKEYLQKYIQNGKNLNLNFSKETLTELENPATLNFFNKRERRKIINRPSIVPPVSIYPTDRIPKDEGMTTSHFSLPPGGEEATLNALIFQNLKTFKLIQKNNTHQYLAKLLGDTFGKIKIIQILIDKDWNSLNQIIYKINSKKEKNQLIDNEISYFLKSIESSKVDRIPFDNFKPFLKNFLKNKKSEDYWTITNGFPTEAEHD